MPCENSETSSEYQSEQLTKNCLTLTEQSAEKEKEEQCLVQKLRHSKSIVSDLNIDGIEPNDVFKDLSIFNNDEICEVHSTQKHKNIFNFLDEELEIKQVNIKQMLDSH